MNEPPFPPLPDDPKLAAFAFDEIEDATERATLAAAVARDPTLAAEAGEWRAFAADLRDALASEPMPQPRAATGMAQIVRWPFLAIAVAAAACLTLVLWQPAPPSYLPPAPQTPAPPTALRPAAVNQSPIAPKQVAPEPPVAPGVSFGQDSPSNAPTPPAPPPPVVRSLSAPSVPVAKDDVPLPARRGSAPRVGGGLGGAPGPGGGAAPGGGRGGRGGGGAGGGAGGGGGGAAPRGWAQPPLPSAWMPVAPALFQRAVAVLRVRFIAEVAGAGPLATSRVEVLATLKNDAQGMRSFSGIMDLLHTSGLPGVPPGISTVYLEPNPPGQEGTWQLIGGSVAGGVSDTVAP